MPNPPCDVCGKVLAGGPFNLKIHMNTHTGNRPYKCDFAGCGKAFTQTQALTAHKHTHTGEKLLKCDVDGCGKLFLQHCNLKKHKLTHAGVKPYKCDVEGCGKAFSQHSNLKKHKLTHTGVKPYKCDVEGCGKAFSQMVNLQTHQLVHGTNRPHECDICGAAFKRQHHLELHTIVHTGSRPYICDAKYCDTAFSRSHHLEVHKKAWHSKAGAQRKKKQEEAMKNALVLGGYDESTERGRVPAPGEFTREVYFDHRCALARNFMPGEKRFAYVDFVVNTPDGRLVFLEVDEEQHAHNPQLCETTRMWNICESIMLADLGDDINVFWLRVNPNVGFKVGGKTLRTTRPQRFSEVIKFLDNLKSSPSDPPMSIAYAFYDCEPNGSPLVLKDPDFHPDVKPGVVCISKGSQKLIQPCAFAPVNPLFAYVGASDLTAAAFGDEAPDAEAQFDSGSEFEEEDVPEGEAGGSSGKRPRVG